MRVFGIGVFFGGFLDKLQECKFAENFLQDPSFNIKLTNFTIEMFHLSLSRLCNVEDGRNVEK